MGEDFGRLKRERLRDLFRRTMANPERLEEVVHAIAEDWYPHVTLNSDGGFEILGRIMRTKENG